MTFPSPPVSWACVSTRERISLTVDSMKLAGVHVGRAPAMPRTKFRRMSRPCGVWTTSGWNWIAVEAAGGVGEAGEGRGRRLGGGGEAGRQPGDRVAVAHPDRLVPLEAREEAILGGDRDGRRSVLPAGRRQHVAAELEGHQLGPVADAQHRDPPVPDRRVRLRGTLVVDGVGAARQDDRARAAALQLGVRRVVRQQLRVDVELADAAGDELGELAAEVEDDDRVGLGRARLPAGDGSPGTIDLRTLGRPGVEGDLEVGLDLGVVRGEHAVACVGGLAVDGRAALSSGLAVGRRPGRSPRWDCPRPPLAARPPRSTARLPLLLPRSAQSTGRPRGPAVGGRLDRAGWRRALHAGVLTARCGTKRPERPCRSLGRAESPSRAGDSRRQRRQRYD